MLKHRVLLLALMAVLMASFAPGGEAIPNWSAPATWTPPRSAGVHTMTDVTTMLPFIGITPCRIADTRGNGFTGGYGPPSLVANATRTFGIAGQCGIPIFAQAVSFNFGALNVGAAGDLRVFPAGGAVPTVSTMNYNANTPNIANAAIVPLGGGAITVQADAVSVDLIIDVNGYYAPIAAKSDNLFAIESIVGTGQGVIEGLNDSNAGSAFGVLGEITTAAPGPFAAGVRGLAFGTDGDGIGVWGSATGDGWGVYGTATGTTGTNQKAVYGIASSDGAGTAGVEGFAEATTGAVWGVEGAINSGNTSFGAAGVYGTAGGGLPFGGLGTVGVYGANASTAGWGVVGSALQRGVQGNRTDTAGTFVTSGVLGFTGTIGVYSFNDYGGAGVKYFIEPHPTDPTKQINYVSLEGPEAGTYFRGTARSSGGRAVIQIPEDFGIVTDDNGLTVQLTPVGAFAQMYVESQDLNQIVVRSSRDVTFHYLVQGVRKGYADLKPIRENEVFVPSGPNDRMGPYPERIRQRLVSLGIYNEDGTVNMDTARRLGWDRVWEARAEQARAAAVKKAASVTASQQQ